MGVWTPWLTHSSAHVVISCCDTQTLCDTIKTGWVFLTSIDWFVCSERLKASACSVGKTLGYFQWLVPGVYMHFHRIRHAIYMVRFFCIDLQFLKIHSQNNFFHSNFGNFTIQIIYFSFNHIKYKFVKIFWNIMQYM